jgi:protoporphyrinogen oxidase
VIKEAFKKGFIERAGSKVKKLIDKSKKSSRQVRSKSYGGIGGMSEKDTKGYLHEVNKSSGPQGSMLGWLAEGPTKKIVGKKRYERASHGYNRLLSEVDSALGKPFHHVASKFDLTKNLFKSKERVHTKPGHFKEVDRVSVTAPLRHAHELAAPIVLTGAGYKAIEDRRAHKAEMAAKENQHEG